MIIPNTHNKKYKISNLTKNGYWLKQAILVAWVCLFAFDKSVFAQTTVTLTSSKAQMIYQGGAAKTYGTCNAIGMEGHNTYRLNSIVEFNLSSIPAGATITAATLRLVHHSGTSDIDTESGSAFSTDIKRVTRAWTEGTACNVNGASNWTSAGSSNWTSPGGDYATTTYGSFTGGRPDAEGTVYTINILTLVNEWFNGTNPNYGLGLIAPTQSTEHWYYIWSDEATDATKRPQLIVTYTLPITATGSVSNATCGAPNSGAINLTVSGGVPPYTYNWGGGVTTEDRTGLGAGTYTVTVTDSNSPAATATESFTVTGCIATPGGVITGLLQWLKADAGVTGTTAVSAWDDQSAGNRDATQATAASQPVLSQAVYNFNPALTFDGTSDVMNFSDVGMVSGAGARTSFALAGRTGINTAQEFIWQYGTSTGVTPWGMFKSPTNAYHMNYGSGSGAIGPDVFADTEPKLLSGGYSSLTIHRGLNYAPMNSATISSEINTTLDGSGTIGSGTNSSSVTSYWGGQIGEIIQYSGLLSATDFNKVSTYLAIKYGISLGQATPTNYVSSSNLVVWNATTNAGYNNNIAGIARDDASGLHQKQSKSSNSGLQVVMGISTDPIASTNQLHTTGFGSDLRFLMWGDNGASVSAWTSTGAPANRLILPRKWKIQEPNTVLSARIQIADNSGINGLPSEAQKVYLLVDADGDFSSGATSKAMTLLGPNWETTFDFTNGQFFTFATESTDTDNDGYADATDLDDDNDGILDTEECVSDLDPILQDDTVNPNVQATSSTLTTVAGQVFTWATNPAGGAFHNININGAGFGKIVSYFPNASPLLSFPVTITFPSPQTSFQLTCIDFDGLTQESITNLSIPPTYVSPNGIYDPISNKVTSTTTNQNVIVKWAFATPVSSMTFTVNRPSAGLGIGFQVGFTIDCDTDNDGILNTIDTDSDNDGCADAVEGGSLFTTLNIDSNKRLTGSVNTNGVPTIATASGQTVGSSQDAATKDPYCTPLLGNIVSQTHVRCFGTFTGTVNVAGSGGVPPYTYKFDSGAWVNLGNYFGIGAGPHTIIVRDANLITTTVNINTTEPAALVATAVILQPQCFAFGGITLNVSGGTGPYTYDWADVAGAINPKDRSGLSGGNYSVIVTDANGCTTTVNATLNTPTGCSPINICRSVTNYTFSVAPDPNNTSYTWTIPAGAVIVSGSNTNRIIVNFTGVTPGTYQVCVRANNVCGTTAQTCQDINIISPIATATANPVCVGGTVQLFASGGSSYRWVGPNSFSSVSTNPSILNATTANNGSYTVTATDVNGCSATATVSVSVNQLPVASATATNTTCGGSGGAITTTVSGGAFPYSFNWNNGATTQNLSNLTAGIYTLTVTDNNGCKAIATGNVRASNGPTITETHTDLLCANATNGSITTTVSGGSTPYVYSWSDGSNTANISNLVAGTYNLTLTDNAGCVNQISVVINQPAAIQTDFTKVDVRCFGLSTGSINLIVSGGTGAYTYSWTRNGVSIPNTTSSLASLSAGVYVATIRDANLCTTTQSVTITQPNAALSATPTITNVKCSGGNDGQITLTVSGGSGSYTYAWTGPSGYTASTKDITSRVAGTYSVTITDGNTCTLTLNNLSITAPTPIAIGTPTINHVNCFGSNNGSISLTISGGTIPYTYLWSNGATTNNLTGLAAGSYSLTVTDYNNCKVTSSAIVVNQPLAVLSAVATPTNPNCAGASTGSINLTVSGGSSPYVFSWSNGSTVQSPTGLGVNIYTVTITDNKGCTTQSNATISNPPEITVNGTVTDVLCSGGNTGAITLTASGGVGTLTFAWSDGLTTQNRTALTAGTYSVTVSDGNGCNTAKSFGITQNSPIVASLINTNISCFGGSNGSINLTVSGGSSAYTFLWSNGQTTEDIAGLSAGTYSVTVKDGNDCSITVTSSAITQPSQLLADAGTVNNVTCQGGSNGSANVIVSGGKAPFTYAWSNGSTSQVATGLSNGTYVVIVNDDAGCVAQDTVTVGEPGFVMNLYAAVKDAAACGGNTGSIETIIENGVSPYIFAWTGPTTIGNIQNPTNLATGNYSLTATDAIGCSATVSVTIGRAPTLTASITVENATCTGSSGTATASVSGGNQPYSFLWTPGNLTTQIITGLSAGSYSVTITDDRGCTVTATANVTFSPSPSATLTNQTICDGQSVTLTPTNVLNTISYLWSINDVPTTVTTASMTVNPTESTSYSLRLTSSAGCVTNIRTFVTVNVLPPKPTFANGVACQGETITLTATSDPNMTVVWTFGGSTMTTAPIPNTSNPGMVIYYVSQFNNTNGCLSESSTQTLTVNPKPLAEVTPKSATCIGVTSRTNASITLSKYNDNDQFAWGVTLPTNPTFTLASTLLNGEITNNLPNSNATYIVRIKNQFGCTIDRTAQIIANPCQCPIAYCEPSTSLKIR